MKKFSNITESVWSDIHKRSIGEYVRKEMSMEEFKNYLDDTYEPVEQFKDLQKLSYNQIYTSVGIIAFVVVDKLGTSCYFLSLKNDNGNYTVSINKTAQPLHIYDLLRKEYNMREAKTWDYIIEPKIGKVDKNFFIDVLDFIRSNVEKPEVNVLRKK